MNVDGIIISKHAYERYAERIMNKENSRDVNIFIQKNSEKIESDIKNMIRYGQEIYTGKPHTTIGKQHNCTYIINGLWIIVIDSADLKVVTLYKIDLGAGEDIDVQFRDRLVSQIEDAKADIANEIECINVEMTQYQSIIDDNIAQINEYRQMIKNLESINEAYSSTISAATKRKGMAEEKIKTLVAALVGKTNF